MFSPLLTFKFLFVNQRNVSFLFLPHEKNEVNKLCLINNLQEIRFLQHSPAFPSRFPMGCRAEQKRNILEDEQGEKMLKNRVIASIPLSWKSNYCPKNNLTQVATYLTTRKGVTDERNRRHWMFQSLGMQLGLGLSPMHIPSPRTGVLTHTAGRLLPQNTWRSGSDPNIW